MEVKSSGTSNGGGQDCSLSDVEVIDSFEAASREKWNRMDDDFSTYNSLLNVWLTDKSDGKEYRPYYSPKYFNEKFLFSDDVKNKILSSDNLIGFEIMLYAGIHNIYYNLLKYFGNFKLQNIKLLGLSSNMSKLTNISYNQELVFYSYKRIKFISLFKNKIIYSTNEKLNVSVIRDRHIGSILNGGKHNLDIIELQLNNYLSKHRKILDYHPSHKGNLCDFRIRPIGDNRTSDKSVRFVSRIYDSDYIGGGGFKKYKRTFFNRFN